MEQFSSRSSMLALEPSSVSKDLNPEKEVRRIVQELLSDEELPPTKSLHLYHVRGVGNGKYSGGEDMDIIIYGPEFVYVLDVGYPTLPAVVLGMSLSGLGDPHFPDFSHYTVRCIKEEKPQRVLFQEVVGRLLIGVQQGTEESAVKEGLSPYSKSVKKLSPSLEIYVAEVRPFHEPEVGKEIEQNISFVRYAEMDGITRPIDFQPGWFVDRVS